MIRVLVTGSRDITDEDIVFDALSEFFDRHEWEGLTITHDGGAGPAEYAVLWAFVMRGRGVKDRVRTALEPEVPSMDAVLVFHRHGERTTQDLDDLLSIASIANIPILSYTQ